MKANKVFQLLEKMSAQPLQYQLTLPVQPSLERDILQYRTSISELAYNMKVDPGKKFVPQVFLFRPFDKTQLSDITKMLEGWGQINMRIELTPQVRHEAGYDLIYFQCSSQGAEYLNNVLSKMYDAAPLYAKYNAFVPLAYVISNLGPIVIEPTFQGNKDFIAVEANILANNKIVKTVPLKLWPTTYGNN